MMNAAQHYIIKSKQKVRSFLWFRKVEMDHQGSFEIKNFQKNLQSKCICHPKIPRIIFISDKMVGRYTLMNSCQFAAYFFGPFTNTVFYLHSIFKYSKKRSQFSQASKIQVHIRYRIETKCMLQSYAEYHKWNIKPRLKCFAEMKWK